MRIGWKITKLSGMIASVRYRAINPILSLKDDGFSYSLFSHAISGVLEKLDVLVFVKSFKEEDVLLAMEAKASGIRVVYDLCDNIFVAGYAGKSHILPADLLKMIVPSLDLIVTPTDTLAEIIRCKLNNVVTVRVIPDGIDSYLDSDEGTSLINAARKRECSIDWGYKIRKIFQWMRIAFREGTVKGGLIRIASRIFAITSKKSRYFNKFVNHRINSARIRIWKIIRRVPTEAINITQAYIDAMFSVKPKINFKNLFYNGPRKDTTRKLVWFGNHGAKYANHGMLDLLPLRDDLEQLSLEYAVELWVISNNRHKFNEHIKLFKLPTFYKEWAPGVVDEILHDTAVALMPNSLDEFSICKSPNRAITALLCGAPVVATATPALDKLGPCIETSGFYVGIKRYLESPEKVANDIQISHKIIEKEFGQNTTRKIWINTLESLKNIDNKPIAKIDLLFAMNLPQDLDLIEPIIREAISIGWNCAVWISYSLYSQSKRTRDALDKINVQCQVLPDAFNARSIDLFANTISALLSASETSLHPHQFIHNITNNCNRAGVKTYTLQHGLENVGLTYDDEIHSIKKISFASDLIFTWGSEDNLNNSVRKETRAKCVPVGCPKDAQLPQGCIDKLVPNEKEVIGVFENLHWHRYNPSYREFFIEGVFNLAKSYPELVFLIKPHNAGKWITSRYTGEQPLADNIIIADPDSEQWQAFTAKQILARVLGVITTPSTVALDAARAQIPTAIVAHNMHLDRYIPLYQIEKSIDWSVFIDQVLRTQDGERLKRMGEVFVKKSIVTGDAVGAILNRIQFDKN